MSEDAKSLNGTLGAADQRKMDEYLTAIREVEQRIDRAREVKNAKPTFKPNMADAARHASRSATHIRLMSDLMVLAFQADLTRVVTFPFANDGSNRRYPMIGVPEGHHETSHHGNDKKKLAKIQKINQFHIEQLAYMLEQAQGREGRRQDAARQVMLVYGGGIGDGNRHNHDDLPILRPATAAARSRPAGT